MSTKPTTNNLGLFALDYVSLYASTWYTLDHKLHANFVCITILDKNICIDANILKIVVCATHQVKRTEQCDKKDKTEEVIFNFLLTIAQRSFSFKITLVILKKPIIFFQATYFQYREYVLYCRVYQR